MNNEMAQKYFKETSVDDILKDILDDEDNSDTQKCYFLCKQCYLLEELLEITKKIYIDMPSDM